MSNINIKEIVHGMVEEWRNLIAALIVNGLGINIKNTFFCWKHVNIEHKNR